MKLRFSALDQRSKLVKLSTFWRDWALPGSASQRLLTGGHLDGKGFEVAADF